MASSQEQRENRAFYQRKRNILECLYSDVAEKRKDESKKGSVDKRCLPIMHTLNDSKASFGEPRISIQGSSDYGDFITTSSCSGRILLWKGGKKSIGTWVFCAHDEVNVSDDKTFNVLCSSHLLSTNDFPLECCTDEKVLLGSLKVLMNSQLSESDDIVYFKMEPFVMHVQCRNLQSAQKLLELSLSSGYRNSGLVVGKKRIICCIRDCSGFQAPIMKGNRIFSNFDHIYELIRLGNSELRQNFKKMERFSELLRVSL